MISKILSRKNMETEVNFDNNTILIMHKLYRLILRKKNVRHR